MVTGVLGVLAFSAAYLAHMSRPVFIKALVGALACLSAFTAPLQAQTNIAAVGHLSYQQLRGSAIANLWGYVDEQGNEYALVGVNGTEEQPGGLSVVDLSDPANPHEIFFLPGPASIWREVKVWNDHVYVTTEAEQGGLTIVDLSPLPQSTVLPSTVWTDDGWDSSHSLFIDEAGRLYIYGANEGNGGVIMYDLVPDPMAPERVGVFDPWYAHDGFARGDTMYVAHIINGFFTIVDVSDPAAPVLLGQQTTPSNFTHNVWLDDAGTHLYTTDERNNSYVAAYDISDPSDIQFLDKLRSDGGSEAVPHNTYWLPGDFLVQSYYTYGVSIYDCSRPDNLVEVGSFDTSPLSGGGYFGAWGVYPFLPSGRLLVSDIEEGLFILEPTYVRGCHLQGTITNGNTGIPVAQATVRILTTDVEETTGISGAYGVGTLLPGTYTVTVNAPGYYLATVEGVVLQTGELTLLDVVLDPLPTYPVSGVVRSATTEAPVPGAQVWFVNDLFTFSTLTDVDGNFVFPAVYDGVYTADIGAWGWHGACPPDLVVNGAAVADIMVELEPGYADDFALDLGWQVSSTAPRGVWERGRPAGTIYQGEIANPGEDVSGDCRDKAYVTGNSGGSPNSADVDEGGTLLTSPAFDATGMDDPHVRFFYWFYNAGGTTPPDDALRIWLTDGADTVLVQEIPAAQSASAWRFSQVRIADHLQPTATMRLLVYTEDHEPMGHLVEAGLDQFAVVPNASAGVADEPRAEPLLIWPVPASTSVSVRLPGGMEAVVRITDALGRTLSTGTRTQGGVAELHFDLANGTYLVHAVTDVGTRFSSRFQVMR